MSFIQSFKTISAKINSIAKDMDEKVDSFADEVLSVVLDYDSDFFSRGSEDVDKDKADMKSAIKKLFDMFKPEEKKKSVNGYILYCNENRDECVRNNPGKKPTEYTKILGEQWKALDKEEKEAFTAKAKSLKPLTDEEKKAKVAEKKKAKKEEKKVEKKTESKKEEKKVEKKKEDKKKTEKKKEEKSESKKEDKKKEKKEEAPASPQTTSFDYKKVVKYSEDPDFWACKALTMDGQRYRIHKPSGLVLDIKEPILIGTFINKEFTYDVSEKIKKWAEKCGLSMKKEEEDEDIALESDLDEE